MFGSRPVEANQQIEDECRVKYLGTARVKCDSLNFQAVNAKRSRNDVQHHVIALISQNNFDIALETTGIPTAQLLTNSKPYQELELPPQVQLDCFRGTVYGMAEYVLDDMNKHCIVDLFLDNLSPELTAFFLDEPSCEEVPDDGEFYCKIRHYQGFYGERNPYFERIWLARLSALSENRRELFDQLSRHRKYSAAFNAMLRFPTLFRGFRLTVIHKMISMRCEEQCLRYLVNIFQFWNTMCNEDKNLMLRIDAKSIETLQGTAPGAFPGDHQSLYSLLKKGHIFGNLTEQERQEIWTKLCAASSNSLIPSLYTFFEDLKFLKSASDCVRRLMLLPPKDTISSRLEHMFTDAGQRVDQCIIHTSGTAYAYVPGNAKNRLDLGCRQLWLAAFRNYRALPAEPQKNKALLAKPRKQADETVLFELASLAARLGFESEEISTILQESPDQVVARRTLLTVRKPERYKYANLALCVRKMTEIFNMAEDICAAQDLSSVDANEKIAKLARCGMPNDADHNRDIHSLFLSRVHAVSKHHSASFFIRRSVYFAFFGQELSVDISYITDERFQVYQPTVHVHGQSNSAEAMIEKQTERSRLLQLAAEERETQWHVAALGDQQEKLIDLENKKKQTQIELNMLERRKLEEEEKLHRLITEQKAQKQQLKYLAESLREQQGRLERLDAEERERQERLHCLAARQKSGTGF